MKLEAEEITPLLRQTIIAKEDKWFYWHPGVNPFAVGRAFFYNVFTGKRTSGASTITMQVATPAGTQTPYVFQQDPGKLSGIAIGMEIQQGRNPTIVPEPGTLWWQY